MKLIVEIENDLVLGVHLICSEAPELIQMIAISFKIFHVDTIRALPVLL